MENSQYWDAIDAQRLTPLMSRNERHFYNICDASSDVGTVEFLNSGHAGVLVGDSWEILTGQENCLAYFKPSASLTTTKRLFLDQDSFAKMDMGIDPYSLGLWQSQIYKNTLTQDDLKPYIEKECRIFRLTGQAYAVAGAGEIQELAILLSSFVQLIRDYEGLFTARELFKAVSFEVTLTANVFRSMAKLFALRLMLEKILESDSADFSPAKIYGVPSVRFLSTREPWNNMLRITAAQSASVMGGADGFISLPFDLFTKSEGSRLSRNSLEILMRESFLGEVDRPAEGSFVINRRVDELCAKAWSLAREIENKGGLTSVLRSGWIHLEIERSHQRQLNQLLKRDLVLTGVNQFAMTRSLDENFPLVSQSKCQDIEGWWSSYQVNENPTVLCDVERVIPFQLSQVFEDWQFRSDRLRQKGGGAQIPVIFENTKIASKKRPGVADLLGVAGLEILEVDLLRAKKERVLVILSSDPDGDFVRDLLLERNQSPRKLNIWVGEKMPENFDLCVNKDTHLGEFFGEIFETMEGVQ